MGSAGLPWGKIIFKCAMYTTGGIFTYKLLVPSPQELEKSLGIKDKDYSSKQNDRIRFIELSKEGYSYEAITKIIAKEKLKAYKEFSKEEAAKEVEKAKEMEKAEKDVISRSLESAASTLLGK